MPRNRPGALRAATTPGPRTRPVPPPSRIPGLSVRTSLAIHRADPSGTTASALRAYRAFLAQPGRRPLHPRASACPACPGCALDDVREARDVLAGTVPLLPPRPRSELSRTLAELDRRYRLRTLPDPRVGGTEPWWRRRLAEGAEGW
ncbi:hypothetical protein [Streptomyces canus]|uniref:hypothetical protein n=1 Tax=Streptomyces canus TaxID=58343 RepID=UPI003CF76773